MNPVAPIPDSLSEPAARRLCRKIEAYWARRRCGPVPLLRVELSGDPRGAHEDRRYHVVRSDMVNGLPVADKAHV